MTQITCSALLFDLDGVLIDSTPAVTRVWTGWAIAHGFDPDDVVRKAHGRPSIATIGDYLPHGDHEAENREVERREIEDLEGVVTLPGARELLSALPSDRWTIVTSCTRPLAEVRLRAAGLPIPQRLLTSDDVKNGKPDPEPYLKGASLLGVSARDCVVVEDVPAGIRAGKAAGARVIACRTTVSEPELKAAGADWIVDNCRSISVSRSNASAELSVVLTGEHSIHDR
ncbi:MAG TPA: HAD family hydrolase [Terriglobales bacterium]|nr:HAD family hydrolase [Terriglobales bacterium]